MPAGLKQPARLASARRYRIHKIMNRDTNKEFAEVTARCRAIFAAKLRDYGTSWRIMRPESITDQIMIKAMRIRSIQEKGVAMVSEGVEPEFIGIVNYSAIGLIQLEAGPGESMPAEQALERYDFWIEKATSLMRCKNHDYDEAWRLMRVPGITDIILQKLLRTREIEEHHGVTEISEGVDANYMDMINYAIFALIHLMEQREQASDSCQE